MSERLRDQWWERSLPRSKYRSKAVARGWTEREVWRPAHYGWAPHDAAGRQIKRMEWVGESRFDFIGACSGGWATVGPVWGRSVHFGRPDRMMNVEKQAT